MKKQNETAEDYGFDSEISKEMWDWAVEWNMKEYEKLTGGYNLIPGGGDNKS